MSRKLLVRGQTKLERQLPLNRYLRETAEMPQDVKFKWSPLDGPQRQAYETPADELFYGGSAGGGKSELLLGLALTAQRKSIVFRREYPQLQEIILRSQDLIGLAGKFNGQKNLWRALPEGRFLEFGAVQQERDWLKYQGRPHDFLGFDEITHFTKYQYQNLCGWARTTKEGQRVRVVCTGNPPTTSEGEWVLDHWAPWLRKDHPGPANPGELRWFAMIDGKEVEVEPEPFTHKGEVITPKSRTFIPARLSDNPYLSQTDYASVLQRMPEPLRSQLLYGDFSIKVDSDAWAIIPRDFLLKARARYDSNPKYWDTLALNYGWTLGVDVGDKVDPHSIAMWRGPVLYQVKILPVLGDDEDTARLVDELEKLVRRLGGDVRIAVDKIGVGAHVVSDLKRRGYRVYPCIFGESAHDKAQFNNRKAELYWKFREGLRVGEFCVAPLGDTEETVFEELRAIRYNTNTEKQIFCEPKEKVRARLKRSPDGADAAIIGLEVEPQLINPGYVGIISERDVLPPEDFDEPINFGLG